MNILSFDDFLFERRSHYETNIDPTFEEFLQKIYEKDPGFKNTYVSFRDSMHVTDINPKNHYNTPTGFYCYPLSEFIKHSIINEYEFRILFPFATQRNHIQFVTLYSNKDILNNYTSFDEIITYLNRLKKIFVYDTHIQNIINQYILTGTLNVNLMHKPKNKTHEFWLFLYEIAKMDFSKNIPTYITNLCNKIGIKGFVDFAGDGYIHPNEPKQAVFFKVKRFADINIYTKLISNTIEVNKKYIKHFNLKNIKTLNILKNNLLLTREGTKEIVQNKTCDDNILYILKYALNWKIATKYIDLTEENIIKYKNFIDWDYVQNNISLTSNILDECKDKLDWEVITPKLQLNDETLEKYIDYLDWNYITQNSNLTPEFIAKYKYYLDWDYIIQTINVSDENVKKYNGYIDWNFISRNIKLSDDFIEKHKDNLNWYYVSQNIKLSDENIEKYKDYLDWNYIIYSIMLTPEFLKKYEDKINFDALLCYADNMNDMKLKKMVLDYLQSKK